jgi:hypothetical protein
MLVVDEITGRVYAAAEFLALIVGMKTPLNRRLKSLFALVGLPVASSKDYAS